VSLSFFAQQATKPTVAEQADDYDTQATACQAQATDLTVFADELVTEAHLLPDSSPRRRALLQAAKGFRLAADGFSDAAEEYQQWARSLREARL
jgi:hypothetical protein